MKIGIIGAGSVGGQLGKLWAAQGHRVMFGVRDPRKDTVRALVADEHIQVGSLADAVAFGELVVLAVPWPAAAEVIASAGDWSGKIVIDATNRFGPNGDASAAEDVAKLAAGASVVKAFNTIGAEHLADPTFGDTRATMFICGDDAAAKSVVATLAGELGFETVDAGPLGNAALLESLARLWVYLARNVTGRDVAFKLLRR